MATAVVKLNTQTGSIVRMPMRSGNITKTGIHKVRDMQSGRYVVKADEPDAEQAPEAPEQAPPKTKSKGRKGARNA